MYTFSHGFLYILQGSSNVLTWLLIFCFWWYAGYIKGLSTFGAEIIKLKEVNKYLNTGIGLIIFDEFARGTNPKEGQKFVRAFSKIFKWKR